jgi:N-acetylglucosaminyldiphosphoundecaprenol N-acetyl-beta-D-mannosaminyltransferase
LKKFRFGKIHADYITFEGALDAIEKLISAGRGGFVVTPNVDHVVLAENNTGLQDAYRRASLSLIDGMPLIWISRLLGHPFLEKISGSDLVWPMLQRAISKKMRVYFLGGLPGIGEKAVQVIQKELRGLNVVGIDSPPFGFEKDPVIEQQIMEKVMSAKPHLVFVALGCPKQELLMNRWHRCLAPAVLLGIGAGLDFIAGHVQRAPSWMSNFGLEWLYRLSQDPKRLVRRYLVRDGVIFLVFLRMCRTPKTERIFEE